MAFDENLAARIRHALARKKGIEEKKMFGGVCFLLNGNMLVGVWREFLIARLGPDQGDEALLEPHVKKMDIVPLLALNASCCHLPLPFSRVLPPRLFRRSFHVPNCGNERVQQARIVALSGDAAEVVVQPIRITSRQLARRRDPQLAQIGSDGRADVRDVFQVSDLSHCLGRFFSFLDHRQFLSSVHRLDRCFPFQCRTLVGTNLLVDQFDRVTASSVPGGRASIVLLAAAFHVLGDSGVERSIGAPHDVDEPFLTGRSGLRLAVLFRHPDKIPGI
jgi:hypothetical protein